MRRSYSASLALKIAKNNSLVSAVLAFSPGEYFQPTLSLAKELAGYQKPIFIASTKTEFPYAKKMLSGVSESMISWYTPSKGEGIHGSRVLWQSSPESEECWMASYVF